MTEAGERLKSGRLARLCRGRKESDGRRRLGWAKGGCKRWSKRVDEPGSEVG